MNKLTNVKCYYTGGGAYVYSALFNNEAWIHGSLYTNWFHAYDIEPEKYEEEIQGAFDCPEEHMVTLSEYPTYGEILESIRSTGDVDAYEYAKASMKADGIDLDETCDHMYD